MVMMLTSPKVTPARDELLWLIRQARAPRVRRMRTFAEQEIIVPTGQYEGQRFRTDRQPYTRLALDAIDDAMASGLIRFMATGPTQSGKTLVWFAIPAIYFLFELAETIVVGLPTMDIARDKWEDDLLPVIERTRYRELLPTRGGGSKGGSNIIRLRFAHGPVLRFMSGGGRDHSRAHFTARVAILTELDSMETRHVGSEEADPVKQIEGRTRAYGPRRRIFGECTTTTPTGRIWTEYEAGTRSRLALRCPHCQQYVTPERDHLTGWQDAADVGEAMERAALCCPGCGAAWTEHDRRQANQQALLVHRDQEVNQDGQIVGLAPRTDTLSFRWSAVNNLFDTMAAVGAAEWRGSRAVDQDNAQRELCQQIWALPYTPDKIATPDVQLDALMRRVEAPARGLVPSDACCLAMGVDVRDLELHFLLLAMRPDASGHVVDYGTYPVDRTRDDIAAAITAALLSFGRDVVEAGWPTPGSTARRLPDQVWIDARWRTDAVVSAISDLERGRDGLGGARFRPAMGHGTTQHLSHAYREPGRQPDGKTLLHVGEGFHVTYDPNRRMCIVHVDADMGKQRLHEALVSDLHDQDSRRLPGSIALYQAMPLDHHGLASHLTAEKQEAEFITGRGDVVRWVKLRHANHWLDCAYLAHTAGRMCLALKTPADPAHAPASKTTATRAGRGSGLRSPDGRPYLITQREQR